MGSSKYRVAGAALVTMLSTLQVFASVINVDYDQINSTQVGAVGVFSTVGGTVWNSVDGNTTLVDEFGAATSVSISNWFAGGSTSQTGVPELFSDTGFVDTGSGGNDTHWISGLVAGTLYDLAVYGYILDSSTFASAVDVGHAGGTASSGIFGTPVGTATLPGTAGAEYVVFSGLAPVDLGGTFGFTITTAATGRTFSILSGFQLRDAVAAPEPATTALLALGLLGAGFARWRAR